MACYAPRAGWRQRFPNENGNFPLRFTNPRDGRESLMIACGQCSGCRLAYADQWATRIMHESTCHESNCFITLTYNDENLPEWPHSLQHRDFQLFLKRLRKHCDYYQGGSDIRYYMCGEYGEKYQRPHFHCILFGLDFAEDRQLHAVRRTRNKSFKVFRSAILEKCWDKGFSEIGTVTSESAGYVARYCLKKQTGKTADEHYTRIHPESGESVIIKPEYAQMSKRPAVGLRWFEKYHTDLFKGFIMRDGKKKAIPKYYLKMIKEQFPEQYEIMREKHKEQAKLRMTDNMPRRLLIREQIAELKLKRLVRPLGDIQ